MTRKTISETIQTEVLTRCQRRCCLCVYLDGRDGVRLGQIAHIDRNPSNNDLDNLIFLCMEHHDLYDTTTSQSKRLKPAEVRHYREMLRNRQDPTYGTVLGVDDAQLCLCELVLDSSFDEFSLEKQRRLLAVIARLLGSDKIDLLDKRRGSVLLTLQMSKVDAFELKRILQDGDVDDLEEFKIVGYSMHEASLIKEGSVAVLTPDVNAEVAAVCCVYSAVLHPEHFSIKTERSIKHCGYEATIWLLEGGHVVRFEYGNNVLTEILVREHDRPESDNALERAVLVKGEHNWEIEVQPKNPIGYMATSQIELLPPALYHSTYLELIEFGSESKAMTYEWVDSEGECASILDVQRFKHEVHVQSYHMFAASGTVLRTQSIFEHRP